MRLIWLLLGPILARAIHVVSELGVADAIASGHTQTDEIARAVGAEHEALDRTMRALAGTGVFARKGKSRYALTDVSRLLLSQSGSFAPLVRYYASPFFRRAVDRLEETARTGHSAFRLANDAALFEYLATYPREAAIFDAAMAANSAAELAPILEACDLSRVTTVVDVGGGRGSLIAAVLTRYPNTRGVLFEREGAAIAARQQLSGSPVISRLDIQEGDFFRSVPRDAGAYLLKSVLHDWGDDDAIRILRTIAHAMHTTSRLYVIEPILSPGRPVTAALDLLMLAFMGSGGGRYRTTAEHQALMLSAGLTSERVVATAGRMSVVTARPRAGSRWSRSTDSPRRTSTETSRPSRVGARRV